MQMGSPSGLALFLESVPLMKTWHSYTPVSAAVTFCRTKDRPPSVCPAGPSGCQNTDARLLDQTSYRGEEKPALVAGSVCSTLHRWCRCLELDMAEWRSVPAPLWWFSGLKQSREVKVTAAAASQTETAELCWTGPEYEEVYHQLGVWQNMIHIEFSEQISLKKSSTSIWIWMTFVFSLTFNTFL